MKLSDLLFDGNAAQQKKKAIAVYAVLVTLILLVALVITLCVTSAVLSKKNEMPEDTDAEISDDEGSGNAIPSGYVEKTFDASQLYSGSLILVNESNPVNAASSNTYVSLQSYPDRPKTPQGTNTYTVDKKESKATTETAAALNKMLGDYYKQNADDNLIIFNAYNSGAALSSVYESGMVVEFKYFVNYTADNNDLTKAGIYGVAKYNWIYENAYKYGFICLAEAKAEGGEPTNANLFRYVGVAHATAMKQKNLATLESYLAYLKTATSVSKALTVNTSEGKMRIYYCAADATAYVSEKNAWQVSGNNIDGYVITVNTSVKAEVQTTADTTQAQ